jgi:hypothetical protein
MREVFAWIAFGLAVAFKIAALLCKPVPDIATAVPSAAKYSSLP